MKVLRNIYNQIGLVFVVVVGMLFYKDIIESNVTNWIVIVLVVVIIVSLGKILPRNK